MARARWTIGAGLLAVASPVWASSRDEPVVLEPTSQWNVNYGADFCRLTRKFGTGKDEIVMLLDRYAPGDSFRLMLIGAPTDAAKQPGTAKLRFGSAFAEQEVQFASGLWGDNIPAWIFTGPMRIRPRTADEQQRYEQARDLYGTDVTGGEITEAEEAMVTEVHIGRPLRSPYLLRTGSMRPAFAALRACTDELITHWGIDVARHKDQSIPPKPVNSPARWATWQDYPSTMLANGKQGIVHFRLTVGEDGKPTACHIQQSTRPKDFDDAVCKAMMRRARFEPARDKDGKPLMSYYINSVRFSM